MPDLPRLHKTVGIDLGTTNSVIAILDATDSTILTGRDEQGRRIFPSVVHLPRGAADAAQTFVGVAGPGTELASSIRSVKRFMGLDRRFPMGTDALAPPEVSARILRHLREVMARTLLGQGHELDSAIITMPAYFNHNQIEATRHAAELAGFAVLELLHEPTAAAIYYSWACDHGDATYLVYDLGGGTFDVSVIRRRFGDYEVLSVSGDPFLGGDDFDRLLASHILQIADGGLQIADWNTPAGAAAFAQVVRLAEGIKIELSEHERVRRDPADLNPQSAICKLQSPLEVDRADFERLIRDKVERTIECCQDALRLARAKAEITLSDIDHVILVGGSSRIPLVRETVRAAFCNPNVPAHARSLEPLLHEPDLCVAYGAALRAATYGTRYRLQIAGERGANEVEVHITSPLNTRATPYHLAGTVRPLYANRQSAIGNPQWEEGGSVRIRALASGLVEEAFLDERGGFLQEIELAVDRDNVFHLTLCDALGREAATIPTTVRHTSHARHLGEGVLPTQIIAKPLQIEVLNRGRQRVKQVIAPVGAALPSTFHCTCRTVDQAGRIVVPLFEENRVIKQMVIADLDPDLPVGSPVDVELTIDVKHNIHVQVVVRGADRRETASIEAPPPPRRPTRQEIDEVRQKIEVLLPEFSGGYRSRAKAQLGRLLQDLEETLRYDDEPKAIQRMAELRELLGHLESARTQVLYPPWTRFAQLVKHCLYLASKLADATGWAREELFEQVYAQERYAEQAYEEKNQTLYRECFENLGKFAAYLEQMLRDHMPGAPRGPGRAPTEQDVRDDARQLERYLMELRARTGQKGRADLQARVDRLAEVVKGLSARAAEDMHATLREVRRLFTEAEKVEQELTGVRPGSAPENTGMLEGTEQPW